ncbi:23S rRNA (guanosine(2251)-2'-O)-methyltransferase RlmB [bacterium]|nr:23S rRNA (guanosine(2251)-2'-O)-methyltransferase RlmB [bacterium]
MSKKQAKQHKTNPPKAKPQTVEKVYGIHSVQAVFLTRPEAVQRVVVLSGQEPYLKDILAMAEARGIQAESVSLSKFLGMGEFTEEERQHKHQGIFIFATPRTIYHEKNLDILSDARVVLALDQVSNPRNFASVLRNAAFFEVDAVVSMLNRSVDITPEVVRIAVGGAEYVKIVKVINLARSLATLKDLGFWIYGLDERGESPIHTTQFNEKSVLVVGAEGEGLRQKTKSYCDALIRIPGGQPGVGSLNVSVATAVALAAMKR